MTSVGNVKFLEIPNSSTLCLFYLPAGVVVAPLQHLCYSAAGKLEHKEQVGSLDGEQADTQADSQVVLEEAHHKQGEQAGIQVVVDKP